MSNKLKVLIGCEFSQVVTKAFRDLGHETYSCDLIDGEINSEWHIKKDIETILYDGWDLMIGHPPCTRLANSGVRWLKERDLWEEMKEGARFFKTLMDAPIKRIALENPIPHKYGLEIIGRKYDQIIQPWQFGHGETKATCLWLKNLPKLIPTNIVSGREQRIHNLGPSKDRWKERSRTFAGIAEGMANQWNF